MFKHLEVLAAAKLDNMPKYAKRLEQRFATATTNRRVAASVAAGFGAISRLFCNQQGRVDSRRAVSESQAISKWMMHQSVQRFKVPKHISDTKIWHKSGYHVLCIHKVS